MRCNHHLNPTIVAKWQLDGIAVIMHRTRKEIALAQVMEASICDAELSSSGCAMIDFYNVALHIESWNILSPLYVQEYNLNSWTGMIDRNKPLIGVSDEMIHLTVRALAYQGSRVHVEKSFV